MGGQWGTGSDSWVCVRLAEGGGPFGQNDMTNIFKGCLSSAFCGWDMAMGAHSLVELQLAKDPKEGLVDLAADSAVAVVCAVLRG